MKRKKKPTEIFDITEKPVPLKVLNPESEMGSIEAIQTDMRGMMYRIADLELTQSEERKQNKEKTKKLLLSIIDSVDALDRVFHSIREKPDQVNRQMKKWIGNFKTIRRMLKNTLVEQGVSEIQNLNQGFDPYWHKAGGFVEDPSTPDGTIVNEILKGYDPRRCAV